MANNKLKTTLDQAKNLNGVSSNADLVQASLPGSPIGESATAQLLIGTILEIAFLRYTGNGGAKSKARAIIAILKTAAAGFKGARSRNVSAIDSNAGAGEGGTMIQHLIASDGGIGYWNTVDSLMRYAISIDALEVISTEEDIVTVKVVKDIKVVFGDVNTVRTPGADGEYSPRIGITNSPGAGGAEFLVALEAAAEQQDERSEEPTPTQTRTMTPPPPPPLPIDISTAEKARTYLISLVAPDDAEEKDRINALDDQTAMTEAELVLEEADKVL